MCAFGDDSCIIISVQSLNKSAIEIFNWNIQCKKKYIYHWNNNLHFLIIHVYIWSVPRYSALFLSMFFHTVSSEVTFMTIRAAAHFTLKLFASVPRHMSIKMLFSCKSLTTNVAHVSVIAIMIVHVSLDAAFMF